MPERGVARLILATSQTEITRITRFSLLLEDEHRCTLIEYVEMTLFEMVDG